MKEERNDLWRPQKSEGKHPIFHADESSKFGFNVKIVVNYRHYFQWLPSFYFQSELVNQRKGARSLIDFIDNAIDGVRNDYFFDDKNTENTTWSQTMPKGLKKHHGTLWPYMHWSSPHSLRNRVEIFDLHQQQIIVDGKEEDSNKPDLFRNFVCQALPTAPETCSQLHENSETLVVRARVKTGLVSSLETGKLSDTELYQLKNEFLTRFQELLVSKPDPKNLTTTYDIDHPANSIFKFRSIEGRSQKLLLANFYDWAEQRRVAPSNDDHRHLCLSDESTLALKTISWNMLRHLEALVRIRDKNRKDASSEELDAIFKAPAIHRPKHPLLLAPQKYDQYKSIINRKNEDWWAPIKRIHDKLFEDTVQSGAYCELDIDRLFADENFMRQIFYRLDSVQKRANSDKYVTHNESY